MIATDLVEEVTCPFCGSDEGTIITGATAGEIWIEKKRCKDCGLVYLWRQPTLEYQVCLEQETAIEEGLERSEATGFSYPKVGYYDSILEFIARYSSGRRLLDFGCGDGKMVNRAQIKGWDVYGVDIHLPLLQYAKGNLGARNVVVCSSPSVFQDQAFDAVALVHVLEHLRDPRQFLSNLGRCLRPGGVIYVEVPNEAHLRNPISRMKRRVRKSLMSDWTETRSPFHLTAFEEDTLRSCLRLAGYDIIKVCGSDAHGLKHFFEGLNERNYRKAFASGIGWAAGKIGPSAALRAIARRPDLDV